MSPSANHKPRLSMWGMLLTLAQQAPNANNCNVLATIKHSTQTPDIRRLAHKHVQKNALAESIITQKGEFPNTERAVIPTC